VALTTFVVENLEQHHVWKVSVVPLTNAHSILIYRLV
jgi:hypothetical protein